MMIGAMKCGTTSIAEQLALHPQICFSKVKEPGYFHKTENWRDGLEGYHALYDPEPGQLCGEGSTFYTFFPEFTGTHERLYEYNPALKLIYVMRHPISRIISHYTHNFVREIDKRPPEQAVFEDPRYINRSRYGVQIRPYLELFSPENVLLLFFEEYTDDQIATLHRIADFLEINPEPFAETDTTPRHQSVGQPYIRFESVRNLAGTESFQKFRGLVPTSVRHSIRDRFLANKLDEKPEFSSETRQALWRLLEDDVYAIETLLERRLTFWRQGYTD